jgi:hypothetical protein
MKERLPTGGEGKQTLNTLSEPYPQLMAFPYRVDLRTFPES